MASKSANDDRLAAGRQPTPRFDPVTALALLAYQQRHNLAACFSQRKRRLQHLTGHDP